MENQNQNQVSLYSEDRQLKQFEPTSQDGRILNDIVKKNQLPDISFLKEVYNCVKIREAKNEPDFISTIAAIITKVSVLAGIKNEIDFATKADLLKFIKTSCNGLTLEELYKAFELERFGVYDEKTSHYGLLNAEYCAEVVKKYQKWKIKKKTDFNISAPMAELPEMTESEIKQIVDSGIVRVFKEYSESKIMPEPNGYIFDELFTRKLIKGPTTPALLKYYNKKQDQAAADLEKEIRSQQHNIDKLSDRKEIAREIDRIISRDSEKINLRAKAIILTEYFEKLILEGKNIKDLI